MSGIMIRGLDPGLKERLRLQAAKHGRSMEAEARLILQSALNDPDPPALGNLYDRIHRRFAAIGHEDEIELPPREGTREPPRFD